MSEDNVSARFVRSDQMVNAAAVSEHAVDALLGQLPSVHGRQAVRTELVPLLRGSAWRRRYQDPAKRARRAARVMRHIRFVYFVNVDDDSIFGEYHHELVTAEVLMDRVLAARAAGMKAVHPGLDGKAEDRLFTRPQRGSFSRVTPEYIRWYGRDGAPRQWPMVKEDLAIECMGEHRCDYDEALELVSRHSGALSRAQQSWLAKRAKVPVTCRPLHADEFLRLVKAIEAAYNVPYNDPVVARANRDIAQCAAAALGAVIDEYVATPFQIPDLAQAFADFHSAHLQRLADMMRLVSILPLPAMGVTGWFSAKRARIQAEVQARMASRFD